TEIPAVRLLIVGDGREKDTLKKLIGELSLEDRIVFTGNLSDVSKPLAAMDVFALPATWREGFGLSIIEAMACRKPVIVTNIWALNSLVQNYETGILVEPRNVKELAREI
ncbi:MAG: glycosyltransferase, partial [Candidatus Omnitrophica bacterium]|nr:glycosyltransferase [Candidatus Omnitrophota bacterium]